LSAVYRGVRQSGGISEPTPPRSGKAAAAADAKTLLADRIALVNTLGDALDVHRKQDAAATQARGAEHQAAEAARTAYAAALAGGWTAQQLSDAGLRPPKAPRTRKPATNTPRPGARTPTHRRSLPHPPWDNRFADRDLPAAVLVAVPVPGLRSGATSSQHILRPPDRRGVRIALSQIGQPDRTRHTR